MPTREQLITSLRRHLGTPFGHQGRGPNVFDCGGLILAPAREFGLTELEVLGYASYPTDGTFEQLLRDHSDFRAEYRWPFVFHGSELKPGDMISFDYGNGEGTRHIAWVSRWDGRRFHVIEAQPAFGVCEHALATPFVNKRTRLMAWSVRGLED